MRRRLAPPAGVPCPDAAQDLAEPLEARNRPRRQEVVDVREGRPHAPGERLVAGRAGQRVEPHQPVAVPPEPGRLGRDQGGIAAIPAIGDHDDDARRPQGPPRPMLVEGPE